jgi:hypothetical protein
MVLRHAFLLEDVEHQASHAGVVDPYLWGVPGDLLAMRKPRLADLRRVATI